MRNKIRQVAVLIETNVDWGRDAIKGIMAYETEHGPWYLRMKPGDPLNLSEVTGDWNGDGIIAVVDSPKLGEKLTETGLPIVNIGDTDIEGFSAPNLRTDDRVGTRIAMDHFLQKGFRYFAFVGPTHSANAREYREMFTSVLSENGYDCPALNYDRPDLDIRDELTEWLHALPKPVGILCWGHGYAQAVVDACLLAEITVPHDVAILSGSNDNFLCNACYPPLSGVLTPMEQIGYRAAELLDRMMQGEKVPDEVTYFEPSGIKERLSTDTLAVDDNRLRQVIAYMQEHAYESITIDDVLKAVPMARSSLEQRFQKAFGRTPAEEIRRLRINKARELLAETDLPMQNIAEASGFSTYNYLSFAFKQVTGMPPRDYRKSVRVK